MDKVELESIVFLQGDDYSTMLDALGDDEPSESEVVEYLLQWWYPGEHMSHEYDASGIDTEFLGYRRQIDGDTFLFSHNPRIGYAGLSRIIRG